MIRGNIPSNFLLTDGSNMVGVGDRRGGVIYTWYNEEYRTVTFLEPPTGDLLTWLQANAVKQ